MQEVFCFARTMEKLYRHPACVLFAKRVYRRFRRTDRSLSAVDSGKGAALLQRIAGNGRPLSRGTARSVQRRFKLCPSKNAAFKTYAGVCIQNRMVAAYRAGVRKKSVPVHRVVSLSDEQTEQLVLQSGNQAQNPEALLIDREDLQRIYQGIQQRLSRLEQQVFFLYLSGKKYGEIANTLSISPKSADNAVQRVRKKLQACSSICPGSLS